MTNPASGSVRLRTNAFTAPAFDSLEVSTNNPQLDLSTTSYAGLAVGASAWWRVQVKDGAGLWSGYSDPVNFTRTAKGTLAINSPTGGVVNDSTQEIIWTLTGATQTGWRITVWDQSDPSVVLYDTGRRAGTDTSFTLPAQVITSESTTYRLRVRVWDILGRVTTPGDTAHTEAITTFAFAPDGTVIPVTNLVAVPQDKGRPHVQLYWNRATAPDFYSVTRNGKFIAVDLDPAQLLVTGTYYTYADRTATPGQDITYWVRSKVNGKLGSSASVTIHFVVREVWLADFDNPLSSRLVPVDLNLADCQFSMPEVNGVYQPVNGAAPVVYVQGQQGLAGTIVGRIVDHPWIPASNSVGDMLWFKKHPENQIRMTIGNQNLRVVIRNVSLAPLGTGKPNDRVVSFDFASLDGPTQ